MTNLIILASDSITLTPGLLAGVGTAIATGITAAWAWFRGELNDCKADRKNLYARIEQLHLEMLALSQRVGKCERTGGTA